MPPICLSVWQRATSSVAPTAKIPQLIVAAAAAAAACAMKTVEPAGKKMEEREREDSFETEVAAVVVRPSHNGGNPRGCLGLDGQRKKAISH